MKLFFTFCTLFLLMIPNNGYTFWVDEVAEPHILDNQYSYWPKITKKTKTACMLTLLSLAAASGIKSAKIFYNWLEKDESISWKNATFFSCCALSSSCLLGYLRFSSFRKKSKYFEDRGALNINLQRPYIKDKAHHFATAVLIHNKNIIKKNKQPWQQTSIDGLIQLESLASQNYEKRLTKIQQECPLFLSWLLPPQNFETYASFTINNRNYPFKKPCKENWLRALIRTLLSPPFPQRSLALQEKIMQKIVVQCLQKRLKDPTEDTVGTLLTFPPEIIEHIFSYVPNSKSPKIDISNEEFFINILPYIEVGIRSNYLRTDGAFENEVRLPKDTWQLIDDFYEINHLFHGGKYTRETRTLALQKKMLQLLAEKHETTEKRIIKKIARTLNLQQENITYNNDDYLTRNRVFGVV